MAQQKQEKQEKQEENGDGQWAEEARASVLGVASDLKNSIQELWKKTRDQVVMVRVDRGTTKRLDSWVETGAVKSRSEAAALFIREGLELHEEELSQLGEALQGVETAREVLREKARQVFGGGGDSEDENSKDDEA